MRENIMLVMLRTFFDMMYEAGVQAQRWRKR